MNQPVKLPELTSDYPVAPDQTARFRCDGHILLQGVASKVEIAAYRPAILAEATTFHSGWTLHGAPGNSSHRHREVMTIIWHPEGTRVGLLDNANRVRDRDRWLPGLQPGDLAASDLNPLVYQR